MRATCPVYFILLGLITLIIFDEDYKLERTSLCRFLQIGLLVTAAWRFRMLRMEEMSSIYGGSCEYFE
jgi:hypothetical protein